MDVDSVRTIPDVATPLEPAERWTAYREWHLRAVPEDLGVGDDRDLDTNPVPVGKDRAEAVDEEVDQPIRLVLVRRIRDDRSYLHFPNPKIRYHRLDRSWLLCRRDLANAICDVNEECLDQRRLVICRRRRDNRCPNSMSDVCLVSLVLNCCYLDGNHHRILWAESADWNINKVHFD